MREVNFSIPNANKASVGITALLYDRRALDCTSSLPLINSLNHLTYLTTSSARIRDILCVDGGIEKLVVIMKRGRGKDTLSMWIWNLAFQCVVNIGVRGSENVRTRVVEADMVPVIATILDNYIRAIEKARAKAEEASRRRASHNTAARMMLEHQQRTSRLERPGTSAVSNYHTEHQHQNQYQPQYQPQLQLQYQPQYQPQNQQHAQQLLHTRRPIAPASLETQIPSATTNDVNFLVSNAPPPPPPPPPRDHDHGHDHSGNTSGPSRYHLQHHHQHHPAPAPAPAPQENRDPYTQYVTIASVLRSEQAAVLQPTGNTRLVNMDATMTGFGPGPNPLHPVRDADRLPSMSQTSGASGPSQPVSPTTPNAPATDTSYNSLMPPPPPPPPRQSIRHQRSVSDASEEGNAVEMSNAPPVGVFDLQEVPMVGIQTGVDMGQSVDAPMNLGGGGRGGGGGQHSGDSEALDGSGINNPNTGNGGNSLFPPGTPATNATILITPENFQATPPRYLRDSSIRTPSASVPPSMPREEDVLMSLQLLAYVSKYCDLRSYFQYSHLVPKLSIKKELHMFGTDGSDVSTIMSDEEQQEEEEEEEEYLLPDDYNIFPLVEKFTVRYHPQEMQYWAGVVMRNLCRKDDSRGGIRQCANYECGKWEAFPRQFAKCRRCRRTKYCSKECQKCAWIYHRHWCIAAQQ